MTCLYLKSLALTVIEMSKFEQRLTALKIKNQIRSRIEISARRANRVIIDNQECLNFCSNDYLGLASHPIIIAGLIAGINEYGFGSASSPLISGYFTAQKELEEKFAQFLNRDRAIYFNSGYQANLGVIQSLASREDNIISDRLCHASIIDAISLSKATHARYRHNDIKSLERKLVQSQGNKIIVTEGVFSMEGDITPLKQISELCTDNMLILDDAHAIGVIGKNGKGSAEYHGLKVNEIDCIVAPLGKAFCSIGAIVVGDDDLIEMILQSARSYIYSTAMPPAIACATIQALKIVENESWRREQLNSLIDYFINGAKIRNLPLISSDPTPIMSILIGDNLVALKLQQKLLSKGFYVSCVRPPTVPLGKARLRITLNCNHTKQQISLLLDQIRENYEK